MWYFLYWGKPSHTHTVLCTHTHAYMPSHMYTLTHILTHRDIHMFSLSYTCIFPYFLNPHSQEELLSIVARGEGCGERVIKEFWMDVFCCSVSESCLTLFDPFDCSRPDFPVLHYLLGFAQAHVHWLGDAICVNTWVTNKDLLSSTGNSDQCYVAAWMWGEFGGGWIHVCVCLSPFAVHLKLSQHC